MLSRIACLLVAAPTLQSPAFAPAEEEVVAAIDIYRDLGGTARIVRKTR